jgi:uncharacterized protein (DUF433 family)
MPLPAPSEYPHVTLDERGVPVLTGTTMKVVELVMAQKAYGWSPEELHFQHPDLPLSQIHAALAYYWDHRTDLDRDIDRRSRFVEEEAKRESASNAAPLL